MRFVFIEAEKATYPVRVLCRVLEVSAGGFYEWRRRRPGPRAQQEQALRAGIAAIHKESDCFRGARKFAGSCRSRSTRQAAIGPLA